MKNYLFFSVITLFIFSGCSTKEGFVPKKLDSKWTKYELNKSKILDTTSNVALLENNKILTKKGTSNFTLEPSHRLISEAEGWIITASIDGSLLAKSETDKTLRKSFNLNKTVAGASIRANILAVIFADNEMALYDLESKDILFQEQGSKYIAADARIVNPYFMNDLVVFPSLDGKVIIVNTKMKKRLRTVIVSSEDIFNNIISLNIIDNKIIAATGSKILALSQEEKRTPYEIRDIVVDDKRIFVATKQGEIFSLDSNLDVQSKIKLPFAHFYGMMNSEKKLYILEKNGYMIVLDKNSFDYTVHEVPLQNGFLFISEKGFYIDNEKISVE